MAKKTHIMISFQIIKCHLRACRNRMINCIACRCRNIFSGQTNHPQSKPPTHFSLSAYSIIRLKEASNSAFRSFAFSFVKCVVMLESNANPHNESVSSLHPFLLLSLFTAPSSACATRQNKSLLTAHRQSDFICFNRSAKTAF